MLAVIAGGIDTFMVAALKQNNMRAFGGFGLESQRSPARISFMPGLRLRPKLACIGLQHERHAHVCAACNPAAPNARKLYDSGS